MYNSPRQGQTTYWGQNFDDNRKAFSLCPYVASFKMISSKSDFIHIFNDFIHSPGARAYNPLGTNFRCQQKALITLPICWKFENKCFQVRFYIHFLKIHHMYIAPGSGRQSMGGGEFLWQQKGLFFLPIYCKFQDDLFEICFVDIFNDFVHVYSPGARAENPLGTNVWCQQKALITSTICCKFQTNLFEFWYYTHFLMFFHIYIALVDNPLWTKSWCEQKSLVTLPICCKFQKNIFEVWCYT